jgi:hypothetical protein
MEVLIAVSRGQATLPVAKLGGQRLICARFMTSYERMERCRRLCWGRIITEGIVS